MISFYEKKEIKEWMGFVARTEQVFFERWKIPITMIDRPSSKLTDDGDIGNAYRNAYDHVTKCVVSIIDVSFFP